MCVPSGTPPSVCARSCVHAHLYGGCVCMRLHACDGHPLVCAFPWDGACCVFLCVMAKGLCVCVPV